MFSVIRVTSGGKPDQSFCFRTRKDLDRFRVFCRIYAAESGGNSHGSYHIGSQLADRIVRGSPLVGPRALPHLSMIHLMADGVLEQEIPTLLSMCMGQFRAVAGYDDFVGTLGSLRLFGNWWFWLTPRTPELDHLHDVCVQVFAPRRAGDVEISWPMNDDQREMHRKYGYPAVLRGFNPHITLAVLEPEKAKLQIVRHVCTREEPHRFRFRALAGAVMGEYGEVLEILHEIPFLS